MLLINICVLVGAILTPPSLWWLYSTHIALLCLYQILSRNWQGLTFIGFSLFALVYAGVWVSAEELPKRVEAQWSELNQCYLVRQSLVRPQILVIQNNRRFYAPPCINDADDEAFWRPIKLVLANSQGGRVARYGYSKAVGAVAYLPATVSLTSSTAAGSYFQQFASWRYSLSLIKGDRTLWDERDKWLINHLGLTHLFVVSGLHVGFVCVLALLLSNALWRAIVTLNLSSAIESKSKRWIDLVFATLLCGGYAGWSGVGEPAIRATIMAFLFLAIRAKFSRHSTFNVLALSAWGMLLFWPARILDASYWLSFGFVLLLVWCVNKTPKHGRVVYLQCILSIFAVLFTWGWQSSISSVTIIANLVMIPLVAFVWFPVTLVALMEFAIFNQSFVYAALDYVLVTSYSNIEELLIWFPAIPLIMPAWGWQKSIMVAIAYFALIWMPTLRGKLLLLSVTALIVSGVLSRPYEFQVRSDSGSIVLARVGPYMLRQGDMFVVDRQEVVKTSSTLPLQIINQDWRVVVTSHNLETLALLRALSVSVVELETDERISVRQEHGRYRVYSSTCLNVLNLLKTDGCEHAENLESVLN